MKLWKVNTTDLYGHVIVMAETDEQAKIKANEELVRLELDATATNAEELRNGVSVEFE